MNPKLLIMSLLGLACTINGQGTDSTNPIANVPAPSKKLTIFDLPSPQEIEAAQIAALKRVSVKSTQDKQAAIQSQLAAESARNKMESEMANQAKRNRIEERSRLEAQSLGNEMSNEADARAVWTNFPPLPEPGLIKNLPTELPSPTGMGAFISRSSGTQADGQISVGNLQVVYNDELRTIMRDYNITPEEIRQMLELYAQGGAAEITKEKTNPENGLQEIVTFDLESYISQRTGAPITSVSPIPNPLPDDGSKKPVSTSPPKNEDPIQNFLAAERYLRDQIKELDAQYNALNAAYQQGIITRLTRDENARRIRAFRSNFITDLQAIQKEINSRTGGEEMEPNIPPQNNVDNGEIFRNGPSDPTGFNVRLREATGGGGRSPSPTVLREVELQNQKLEEMLRRQTQERGPGRSALRFNPGSIGNLNGLPLPPRGQSPPLTGRPRRNITPKFL